MQRSAWSASCCSSTVNYRLSDIPCALGIAQLERLKGMLAARARVAALYREALANVEELGLPCEDLDGDIRGWFAFVAQLPDDADRARVIDHLAADGIQSKPYLPAIHLMSFYKERFGHHRGEFPVCAGGRAVAGTAVLPGDGRGSGRARHACAGRESRTLKRHIFAAREVAQRNAALRCRGDAVISGPAVCGGNAAVVSVRLWRLRSRVACRTSWWERDLEVCA
ncbi:MAG: DegT/DnrJ/EryC1/StrS family aminotransferase [Solirubrobacterales bacterium]|nr:DegT/DnrJ/EryC1/StrS family aminotransferase [Solirubrobacterales bacterium]